MKFNLHPASQTPADWARFTFTEIYSVKYIQYENHAMLLIPFISHQQSSKPFSLNISCGKRDLNGWVRSSDALLITWAVVLIVFLLVFSYSLKYLNVSANALESIPPSSQSEESLSTLQELYLTENNLSENCGALLIGHQNLRILHIAYNQLLSFPARWVLLPSVCLNY